MIAARRVLELAQIAHSEYLKRKPAEQAELLRTVLLNCSIDAVSLYPTYRNPFDLIAKRVKNQEWSGRADLNCRPLAPQAVSRFFLRFPVSYLDVPLNQYSCGSEGIWAFEGITVAYCRKSLRVPTISPTIFLFAFDPNRARIVGRNRSLPWECSHWRSWLVVLLLMTRTFPQSLSPNCGCECPCKRRCGVFLQSGGAPVNESE